MIWSAILLLLGIATAHAQSYPLYQSGAITPGHAGAFATSGILQDAGDANGTMPAGGLGGLSALNVRNAVGTPFCVNDNPISSPNGYHQLCLGANTTIGSLTGGFLTYNAYGPAGQLPLSINVNGTNYPVTAPVDVQSYGVVGGGVVLTDGQIGAGGNSTGTCDLYSPSYTFAPTRVGQYAVVFQASAAGATLNGGPITAVSGHHATLTTCASTTIASGATVAIAPNDYVGFQAAANNQQGLAVHIPAGVYCTSKSILISPTANNVQPGDPTVMQFYGDGAATYVFACGPMTVSGTNEAVFYRTSTFGLGGGLSNMAVDAAFLADEAVGVGGGKQALYAFVWGWNGLNAEWTCDTTATGSGGIVFDNIRGFTNSALTTAPQEPAYNFASNVNHSACTSITVRNSIFQNASTANIFDGQNGVGNTYINNHPFNANGYAPPFAIKVSGLNVLTDNQLDLGGTQPGGGNPTGIDIAGSNVISVGNWCYFNGGYVSGNCIQIESGEKNVSVTNTMTRYTDSVPAANVIVQESSAGANCIVANNVGASYSCPGITFTGSPNSSFTSTNGVVTVQ